MKRESNIGTEKFDRALSEAFEGDPDCGAFGVIDDLSRRRAINDILDAAPHAKTLLSGDSASRRSSRLRRLVVAAVAAVVVVGTFGSVLWMTRSLSSQPEDTHIRDIYFGEVEAQDGHLFIDHNNASTNAPVPLGKLIHTEDGTAMLRLPTGIAWQMEEQTHGTIDTFDSEHLQVSVLKGESWFWIDPTRNGPSFFVDTKLGRIFVTGTIFVVKAESAEVRVTLLKGKVNVTCPSGRQYLVKAGHTLHLRKGEQYVLPSSEKRRMNQRLVDLDWETQPSSAIAANAFEEVVDNAEDNVAPNVQVPQSPQRGGSSHLLEEIQIHRKQRNWQRVASLYKRLIRSSPRSETAIVSRVSLGDIYLSKLGHYRDALHHFEKYLRSGHTALLPEASYGKCRALRELGRQDQEERCLEKLILRFRGAFQASDAKARLEALRR